MTLFKSLRNSVERDTITTAILFLIPAFFFLLLFIFYCAGYSIYLSFFDWDGVKPIKEFVGVRNWQNLVTDAKFYQAFLNNIKIVILSILIELPMGLVLGFMLYMGGKKLSLFKIAFFLPYLMSIVAIGFLFKIIYDPYFGLVRVFTEFIGIGKVDILGNPKIAIYAVIAVICWQVIPFYMVYFIGSLSSISPEIYEASIIDGATKVRYFFSIAIPMIKNNISNAIVLMVVGSLKYFDLIYVMTEGGPGGATELMATYMYKNSFHVMRMSYGSTIATAMLIIITLISILMLILKGGRKGGSY
jgi:raffinose/stachyose/melibiose transport system permease protein